MTRDAASSLASLLEHTYSDLAAYFTGKLGSAALAAEVIHEAYVRVRQLRPNAAIENPSAYLWRLIGNLAVDRLRQEARRQQHLSVLPLAHDIPTTEPTLDTIVDDRRRLALLRRAIDELPPKCRQVFILRKFELVEQDDIARQLGISRNMVEKHLRKALLHCRTRLDQFT
jgi:RNA polymerase sigma factor (sigma-70 family)